MPEPSWSEKLARMLGVRPDQTEDALQDEPRARSAVELSRRGFFAAGATMVAAPLVPKRIYSFVFAPSSASLAWGAALPLVAGSNLLIIGALLMGTAMFGTARAK
jgi:hypothetical protein